MYLLKSMSLKEKDENNIKLLLKTLDADLNEKDIEYTTETNTLNAMIELFIDLNKDGCDPAVPFMENLTMTKEVVNFFGFWKESFVKAFPCLEDAFNIMDVYDIPNMRTAPVLGCSVLGFAHAFPNTHIPCEICAKMGLPGLIGIQILPSKMVSPVAACSLCGQSYWIYDAYKANSFIDERQKNLKEKIYSFLIEAIPTRIKSFCCPISLPLVKFVTLQLQLEEKLNIPTETDISSPDMLKTIFSLSQSTDENLSINNISAETIFNHYMYQLSLQ